MADLESISKKLEEIGKNMQRIGCLLTGLVTIPIIGLIFFGIKGLIVGIVIGCLIGNSAMKS